MEAAPASSNTVAAAAPAALGKATPSNNAVASVGSNSPVLITIRKVTYEAYSATTKACKTKIVLYKLKALKPSRCTTSAEAKAIVVSGRSLSVR